MLYIGDSGAAILQYDGTRWRQIYLPSAVVRSLAVDSKGRIWVGGLSTIGYLATNKVGELHYISLVNHIPQADRGFSDVWSTLVTSSGVYFRSYEHIFRWDGHHMYVWSPEHGQSFQALSSVRGHVYTSQIGIGLEEIVGNDLKPLPGGTAYKSARKLFLFPWDKGQILISASNAYGPTKFSLLSIYNGQKAVPFHNQADSYLQKNLLYTTIQLRNGDICLNTLNGGTVLLDHQGHIIKILNKAGGLISSETLTAFQDRHGALWLGSDIGVSRVAINSPVSIFARNFLSDVVRFQGKLYSSSENAVTPLSQIVTNPQTGLPSSQPIPGGSQGFRMLVFKDPADHAPEQLLVATATGPMVLKGNRLVQATPALNGINQQSYYLVQSKKDPSRVLIGFGTGVGSMRWDGHGWKYEGRLPHVVYTTQLLAQDDSGNLWASGSNHGILRIQVPPSGMKDAKYELLGPEQGLPQGATMYARFVNGHIYASSQGHDDLYRWEPSKHKFVVDNTFLLPVDVPDVLPQVFALPNGDVWSETDSSKGQRIGIFVREPGGHFHLEEKRFQPLTPFKDFFVRKLSDGYWLANSTLVRFNPSIHIPPQAPTPTLVREVSTGSKIVFGGTSLPGSEILKLPPGTRSMRFQFASTSFADPSGTAFRYMLQGADHSWSNWDTQAEANYSGLTPGHYRFRVISRTSSGVVGKEGDFSFIISPPWYATTAANIVYVVALLLMAILAWWLITTYEREKSRRQTEELEAEARALEDTVRMRTGELESQAAEIAAQKESIEMLSEIGREITASLDLNTILFKLYERVNQIVDAPIFGVGLYHPDTRLIEYTLAVENGKRYAPYTRDMDDKNQFAVWCIEHRRPILINDVHAEYARYIESYSEPEAFLEDGTPSQPPQAMIYLPLIAKDRILGVLSIQSHKKHAYTRQHLQLLQNLASYTSIALDNASAYLTINKREKEVRERAAELVTINRISQALASQLDQDRLLQLVGDQVRNLFQAPISFVSILNRETMTLSFPYTDGITLESRPFGPGFTSQIIRTGQPILINAGMEEARVQLGIEKIGIDTTSFLAVPIRSGGEITGVIGVQSTNPENTFNEADQQLLSTIASAVGVAFHNARLFEETRQAKAAAEEADAAKSAFLSTVSHELRTPLTSVLGFAKIIRRRLIERIFPLIPEGERKVDQTKQQIVENLNVVVSEGERLTKLIDDVLDLAKIEAGKFTWNMTTVSMGEIIERATAATSSLFDGNDVELIRDIESNMPAVDGDEHRLIQVVINLISNAVKFTTKGSIECSARLKDGEIVVSVKDSGVGIAPTDQPKVFEKFKQVGDTLTDKPKGTGLGLPICKEIVEHHGGRIWVESQIGQGSTFFFTIPVPGMRKTVPDSFRHRAIDLTALVKELREKVRSQQTHDKSILVVDDDPHIRSLLRQELTDAGYSVRLAEDGRKALAMVREETPGLIILDVMMPEINGFDVAAVLKNDPLTMHVPIIILSIVEDQERGFRLGVDRYLTKPIDTPSLFQEIDTLIGQGTSHKKVLVVDEDESTLRSLTDVLKARGYQVVESDGKQVFSKAIDSRPDIIILNSVLSANDEVKALRFEKGMENVLFLIYK
jgi:signal transduction histidine kinase/CheY-like chemotaxis protein/ligand-binding sensor domain-containing protein